MKAIVIHQPWAWAIVNGHKPVENRSWSTRYRGPLVIVAGKSRASMRVGRDFCSARGVEPPADLPFGAIVGVVNLVDVQPASVVGDPWAVGPWCWILEDASPLVRPVPCLGKLGLFSLSADVEPRLHRA